MVVKQKFCTSVCRRRPDEDVVMNGLSITPGQMLELTNQGYPISSQNLKYLDNIDPADKDFYIPLQYRRGVDIADLSEHSQEVRAKLKKAVQDYDDGRISPVNSGKE